jgi:hypothetical protein
MAYPNISTLLSFDSMIIDPLPLVWSLNRMMTDFQFLRVKIMTWELSSCGSSDLALAADPRLSEMEDEPFMLAFPQVLIMFPDGI